MKLNTKAPPGLRGLFPQFLRAGFAAFWLILIFSVSNAQAAAPLADTTISNRASADYKDSGGTDQHTLSNEVTTTVSQVGSYTLTSDNTKTVAPGTTAYLPHTLTNTGNGSDIFNITLPTAFDSDLSTVAIFADANADGQPDSATPLCTVGSVSSPCTGTKVQTGMIPPGGKFNFIVAMTVKATAANGAIDDEIVTAVPNPGTVPYDIATLSNTDKLIVANNIPVFAVTKSIVSAATFGPTGSQVTYRLSYTNSGNAAGPLYIKDIIGSGTTLGYSYVTGAKWSSSTTTLVDTDVVGDDPVGIAYRALTVGTITTVEALIANVPANNSGYVEIKVVVDSDAAVGTSETTNQAKYARANDGVADCTVLPCTPTGTLSDTNQSSFTVVGTYGVVANNDPTVATDGDNLTAAGFDLVKVTPPAAPGTVVSFNNVIWNTGNTTDTFNISINDVIAAATSAFPAGTTFQLFKEDGSTPLVSSDADGIQDTGPIAPGGHYSVVLKATLPADACTVVANCAPDKNYTVSVTATSKGNPTLKNTVFDQLATITPAGVDLTNNAGGDGIGPGDTTTVVTAKTVTPGNDAQFDLSVTNNGLANDSYTLSYHLKSGGTLASVNDFIDATLLSGWSVTIHEGNCSALGPVVSNTGTIEPNARMDFCAVVKTPATGATAAAGVYNAYFKVKSAATGASDIKLDTVVLSALNKLTLLTPGVGQIQPGGTIAYPHSLVNGGNSDCGGNFSFDVKNNKAADGWSYVLYQDNGTSPGAIDAGDTVLGGGTTDQVITTTLPLLAAGARTELLVKVQAPSGAVSGAVDVITIFATDPTLNCGPTAPITDTTNVLAGQIRLVKTQALGTWNSLSASCDAPTGAYSVGALSQEPGKCIWYKIVATNEGDADVSVVVINDSTPSYTTYGGGAACDAGATLSAPAVGSAGVVKCATWPTLAPAETKQLEFSVRINN